MKLKSGEKLRGNVIVKTIRGIEHKIYQTQTKGRTYYTHAYNVGAGRVPKKLNSLEKARQYRDTIAKTLSSGEVNSKTLSGDEVKQFEYASRVAQAFRISLSDLAYHYSEAAKLLPPNVTLKQAAEHCRNSSTATFGKRIADVYAEFEEVKADKSERYKKDLKQKVGTFAASYDGRMSAIQTSDIVDWLKSKGVEGRNYNNHLTALTTFFKFAQRREYIPQGLTPPEKVDRRSAKRKTKLRELVFTSAEMEKLLSHANEQAKLYLLLGGFAGTRTAEICRLRWQGIKLDEGLIVLEEEEVKGGRQRRIVQIQPNLRKWLEPLAKKKGKVITLARPDKHTVEIVAKNAGVKWKRNGLRHSFVSYRYASTNDEHLTAREAGHTPQKLHETYKAIVTAQEAKEWFNVLP